MDAVVVRARLGRFYILLLRSAVRHPQSSLTRHVERKRHNETLPHRIIQEQIVQKPKIKRACMLERILRFSSVPLVW
jgi:hypothetical protein